MAWLPAAELGDLLGRLPAYTGLTITTKGKLRKQLEEVREQGYAVAVDELEVGLTAIAAPVRNAHGDVVCSMSISGPTFRLPAERVDDVVPSWSRPPTSSRTDSAGVSDERAVTNRP